MTPAPNSASDPPAPGGALVSAERPATQAATHRDLQSPAPRFRAPWTTHVRTAGGALKHWFIATCQDALAVGAMWLIGLWIIGVPLAPLWAVLGGLFQFVPNIGPTLSLIGPAMALLFSDGDWMRFIYLLIVFGVVVIVDGLVLQPYLMKRAARVPIWASILAPIVLGILVPFWGVLLAPPLLAIVFAFREKAREVNSG